MASNLNEILIEYWEKRSLVEPTSWEALAWAATELGEVYEILLADGDWVRNNPDKHPETFDSEKFAEELGDVIMMIQRAGMARGVDPLQALFDKINKKLDERDNSSNAGSVLSNHGSDSNRT